MKNLTKKFDVGVVIGRFQIDHLHGGHIEMLDHVNANHDRVIVLLGVSAMGYGSLSNPLDYQARAQMIMDRYPHVLVLPIRDQRSDVKWSEVLDQTVSNVINPRQSVILYGGRDSFIPHYKGKFSVMELESDDKKFLSATEIRNQIKNTSKIDGSFRAGAIWQTYNRYPVCFPTVDIAIVDRATGKTLLARKPGEDLWRFVGGFAEPNSPSFEDDAKREAREETGLEVGDPKYLGSFMIDDWRLAKEKDKIKTLFFVCDYVFGSPKANDDISEVDWFTSALPASKIVPEHRPLYNKLMVHLNQRIEKE